MSIRRDFKSEPKASDFGFYYDWYATPATPANPRGITINIVTHDFCNQRGLRSTVWLLDFTDIRFTGVHFGGRNGEWFDSVNADNPKLHAVIIGVRSVRP